MRRLPLLLFVFHLPGLALGAGELARSQAELEKLSGRIEDLVAEVARDTSKADNITAELDFLDQSKAALDRRIRQNEQSAQKLDSELEVLRAESETLNDDLLAARTSLAGLVRSRYMLRNVSPLRVLLDQQEPQAAARRLTMFRYVLDSGNRELAKLEQLSDDVRRNREATLQSQQALADVRQSLDRDRETLAQEETAYRERLLAVRRKLTESADQITLYRKKEESLQKLIAELSRPRPKPAVEQKAAKDVAKQAAEGPSTASKDAGRTRPKEHKQTARLAGGFSRQRGRLDLPLTSPLSARFGERRQDSGLKWEGLLFDSVEGEPVHAIFPGQVVFSDWFRGYGQLMVVDHGDGFMSLYGHNRELRAGVGELVDAGQVIARAAAAGEPPVPGMYFEIRHNGAPDDPLKWCR